MNQSACDGFMVDLDADLYTLHDLNEIKPDPCPTILKQGVAHNWILGSNGECYRFPKHAPRWFFQISAIVEAHLEAGRVVTQNETGRTVTMNEWTIAECGAARLNSGERQDA